MLLKLSRSNIHKSDYHTTVLSNINVTIGNHMFWLQWLDIYSPTSKYFLKLNRYHKGDIQTWITFKFLVNLSFWMFSLQQHLFQWKLYKWATISKFMRNSLHGIMGLHPLHASSDVIKWYDKDKKSALTTA